jgi:hypothetical protein
MSTLNAMTGAGSLAGLLLLPVHAAAGQSSAAADSLAATERTVIEASARDGFAAAISAVLTPDGAILWPGAPVVAGPDLVRRLLSAQKSLDSVRITWQPLGTELASDGTLGVTWGVSVAVSGGGAARLGRYIAAWRRDAGVWRLAAFVPLGLIPSAAVVLPPEIAALRHPPLTAEGPAGAFISADLAFARLAGDSGAALAFERFAAPDAITFGGGPLNRGPAAIGRSLLGGPPSQWAWHPVLAGAASSGDLGFTIGESVIRPEGGAASYGKYLTIWRRLPTGEARFVTDGGTARPATP